MEGMEEIVASVSGYHGSERFKIIKLISLSGANYVGAFSRSTTHLVCWKFEGEKYQLAKKFGTKIVNHKWVEDCIKKGKRVPEKSYSLLSGQQVGSITLDIPAISKEVGVLRENKLLLNGGRTFCTGPIIDIECEIPDWDDGCLLAKNEESSKRVSKSSRKQKKRILDDITTRDTSSTDPPRTSRRLVKMNASRYPLETITSNGKESLANEIVYVDENDASPSNHFGLRNENESSKGKRPQDAFTNQRINPGFSEVDVIDVFKADAEGLILQREETVTPPERNLEDVSSDPEKVNQKLKNAEEVEQPARNSCSSDISCAICYAEYSLTRGVLSCGHRFCFTCIHEWSNTMAVQGKTSTCPLCKSSFTTITKVDEADCIGQTIYSQTIPCPSSTQHIFIVPDALPVFNHIQQARPEPSCCQCRSREPADLLLQCDVCHLRCIHDFCLDPPFTPWICTSCRDLRMLYNRY